MQWQHVVTGLESDGIVKQVTLPAAGLHALAENYLRTIEGKKFRAVHNEAETMGKLPEKHPAFSPSPGKHNVNIRKILRYQDDIEANRLRREQIVKDSVRQDSIKKRRESLRAD